MAGPSVELEGATNVKRGLSELADGLTDMSPAHRPVGAMVRAAGALRAPKRSGRLAGSLTATTQPDAAVITSSLVYAGVIHYGWPGHHIAANPFLFTAAQSAESSWSRVYLARVTQLVNAIRGV